MINDCGGCFGNSGSHHNDRAESDAQSKAQAKPAAEVSPAASKSVVVYFSQTGTTKKFAGVLKQAVNADEIELRLVTPYPSTYDSTIAAVDAQRESKQWPSYEPLPSLYFCSS